MDLAFLFTQMAYWLLLAAWFGLVLFGAMVTPIIFRSVEEADPTLPMVLSVNLDGQHAALLSMTIIANVLGRMVWLQFVCAGGLLITLIVQWAVIDIDRHLLTSVLRSAIYLATVGLLVYGWRVVWPRAAQQRKEYIDNADNPEIAETVRGKLAQTQRESEIVQLSIATLLSALILFSANLTPSLQAGTRVLFHS